MTRSNASIAGVLAVTVALVAALMFERVYDVSFRLRPPDPLEIAEEPASRAAVSAAPLELRLVDSGGVGIPLEPWGLDYSHDRRTFRRVILEDPPYVDSAEFASLERDWRLHVERMLEYGNNTIAVPMLLELIDFDRVKRADGSPAVYAKDSAFRARHAAVRRHFARLFDWATQRGMRVFLDADMLSLTAPLGDHLRAQAPDRGRVGIDTANPAVWDVYRAGLEELFEAMPSITGLVVRFGEGGDLYNTRGWPYRSEPAVRTRAALRAMLRGLLPAFEPTGRTLVLRSWTVGIGPLGKLHIDPRVYESVLGDIDSPSLVVSTKFTAGDFFSHLPLNPTLATGRHRRIIELQARPEFEGFAAFPDFLGQEHAHAVRALRARNPRIAGTYVLTQFGGPLHAGPRTLYPLHGFWLWSDANVFVASRVAANPNADVAELQREWAARTFGRDPQVVEAVAQALTETRAAVLQGFYIRPFAEREVRVPGLELPPLMWIFEWDVLGGWHSLLSIVYRGSRDDVDAAIREGQEAAAAVRHARERLQAAFAAAATATAATGAACAACDGALRSLEYQETLFDALAAWRQSFLSYYHWLETGDRRSWNGWREGRARFERAAERHTGRFTGDTDFPAFDMTSATRAIAIAERATLIRWAAGVLLAAIVLILTFPSRMSRLMRMTALAPWRLGRTEAGEVDLRSTLAVSVISLVAVGFITATLTGFAAPEIGAASAMLIGMVALVFEGVATWPTGNHRGRLLVATLGSMLPASAIVLGAIAYLGPLGVWYWFWMLPAFRVALLTIGLAAAMWTAFVLLAMQAGHGWRGRVAGMLSAAGVVLVVLGILLPDWGVALRALDRPLNFAPATDTMLFALRTYAAVNLEFGRGFSLFGAALLISGAVLSLTGGTRIGTGTARPITVPAPDVDRRTW
jgi:hypothetical protein